ncbi:MAG: regulatory protein RecX [Halioglobus sp.]|nr:regulatory protein RecX [Halioglobus sp.]
MAEYIPRETNLEEPSAVTEITPADIRMAAMNLLARREHSVRELRNKLKRRFPDDAVIDEQIARLTCENLQSNLRFAESYARQRIGRGYGPVRVREELRERGASNLDVAAAMVELQVDWLAVASEVVRKKFGVLPPSDIKEKARRARFMQYRGFTADHYQELL